MKQEPISCRADNALAARCQSFAARWACVLKRPIFYLAAYIDNNWQCNKMDAPNAGTQETSKMLAFPLHYTHDMKIWVSFISYDHFHHLRDYHGPTQRPAPNWPDNSNARALYRHRRGQGPIPVEAWLFKDSSRSCLSSFLIAMITSTFYYMNAFIH